MAMDDQMHLHDGERLLVNLRASSTTLLVACVRAIIDAAVVTVILSIPAFLIAWFAFDGAPPVYVYVLIAAAAYAMMAFFRYRFWRESCFRVTTERILLHHRRSILSEPMHTIKWNQFQEGFVQRRKPWELLFGVRGICIRHGTADAHHVTCFHALSYATDLKHYLDKVDSAVRQGKIESVKPFVLMPKGLRDNF